MTTRFEQYRPDNHVKSLSRLQDAVEFTAHIPVLLPNSLALNGAGQRVAALSPTMPPDYTLGQINHYWSKSFPEFVLKKNRGLASKGLAGEQRSYGHYFEWNRNSNVTREPFPTALNRALTVEMRRIAALPEIGEALESVMHHHKRLLSEARGESDFDTIYKNENARFLSGASR